MFDVVIYDSVGLPISHKLYDQQALGGSEFQQLLLAEKLAESGYNVAYLSKNLVSHLQKYDKGNLYYYPLNTQLETKNLILVRNSPYNNNIKFKKVFVWAHDTNYGNIYNEAHGDLFHKYNANLICVSNWQAKLFEPLGWKISVIYNSIPDWVFNYPIPNKKKQFIYASAAWKGLHQTINVFNQLKQQPKFQDYKLIVLNPGYDGFDGKTLNNPDIVWQGAVKFNEVVKHIAESEALLYYNTMAETFGIVPVLASLLETTPLIYQTDKQWESGGALPEIIGESWVANNFNDFIKLIFNPSRCSTYKDREFSQSHVFENYWQYVLELI